MSAILETRHEERGVPAPTYRLDRSFERNRDDGPVFDGPWPRVPVTPMKSFFGLPVRSRFGVPASILGNSRWLETYARLGFDLLCYKTVRSVPKRCGLPPNWVWADPASVATSLDDPTQPIVVTNKVPNRPGNWTTAGSFGMPSLSMEEWRADLVRARAAVGAGQVLIVSVVGSIGPDVTEDQAVADFAALARIVADCGAHIVEANLSCPNVGKREGQTYLDVPLATRIARAVREAVPDRPVLLKVGEVREPERMEALLRGVAGAADGLVVMNAPARRVVDASGNVFFGAGRETCGITGAAIKPIALSQVRKARAIIDRLRLPLQIVGGGGIVTPGDVREFMDAGACAALSSTGATMNPLLAVDLKAVAPEV